MPLWIEAPAKINLTLEVTGRRCDGYHELVSIIQTVTVSDVLELEHADRVILACNRSDILEDNLVERAARLLRERFCIELGCRISLSKRIPVGAGLGGGSSDAAASLQGLSRLWGLDLLCSDLRAMAEALGSDVPFFLYGGRCLVEGRGERVTRLPAGRPIWYLLVNPGIHVSTARVFAELRPDEWTDGSESRVRATNGSELDRPGPNGLRHALLRAYPQCARCIDEVQAVSPVGAQITGSGPTVYAPFRDRSAAEAAARDLTAVGYWTAVVRPLNPLSGSMPCA